MDSKDILADLRGLKSTLDHSRVQAKGWSSLKIEEVLQNQRLNEWGQMVQACRNSGKSVSVWCSENDINEKTYYYRQRRVCSALPANRETRPAESQIAFAEVPPVWNGAASKSAITVRMRSAEIDILNGADPRMVEIVLRHLGFSC